MMLIHLEIVPTDGSADYFIRVQIRSSDGKPLATLGRIERNDPDFWQKLDLMQQSFSMSAKLAMKGEA